MMKGENAGESREYLCAGRRLVGNWHCLSRSFNYPIENPPPEIVDQGLGANRDYFRSIKEEKLCRLNEVKILLVGSGGAGKTSLLKRLSNLEFDPNEDKTHGMEVLPWSNIEAYTFIFSLLLVPVGMVYLLMRGKPFGSSSAYEKTLAKERDKIYLHGNFSAAVFADLEKELEQDRLL